MTRPTIKGLTADRVRLHADIDVLKTSNGELRTKNSELQKSIETTRANFDELEERLSFAERELSRLNGYLDRVYDADIARDGPVTIEEMGLSRSEPRWPEPRRSMIESPAIARAAEPHNYNNRPTSARRRHWTSY